MRMPRRIVVLKVDGIAQDKLEDEDSITSATGMRMVANMALKAPLLARFSDLTFGLLIKRMI